jgi:hypothetical protein
MTAFELLGIIGVINVVYVFFFFCYLKYNILSSIYLDSSNTKTDTHQLVL